MNVVGLGIDLVEVPRVERLLTRHGERAMRRVLTEEERAYCMTRAFPAIHVAARLAAKEAAYKALAQDDEATVVGWLELEVTRDAEGRPTIVFRGRARQAAERLGVRSALVSLTHVTTHAAAVVVLLG